jgi:O-antigen ligase
VILVTVSTSSHRFFEQLRIIFFAPLAKAIAIFWIAVTISGFANGGLAEAIRSFTSLRGLLVYFWAYYCFSREPKLKEQAVVCMLIVGSIAGFWGALQQLTGFHPNSFPYLQGTGFLSGPMAFSGLAQIFSMFIFALLIDQNYRGLPTPFSGRFVFGFLAIGNILGLLFAGERSAWLGAIAALVLSTSLISSRAMIKMIMTLLVVASVCWCTIPVVQQRLTPLLNWQTDVSTKVRISLWREAIDIFKESPVFGVGIRQFPHHNIPEALGQGHVAIDHAHSNYMQILATTGLVGIVAYACLWFNVLSVAFNNWKNADEKKVLPNIESGIYFGILVGVIALLVSGIFEYNFGTAQIRMAQWFLLAMLVPRRKLFTDC